MDYTANGHCNAIYFYITSLISSLAQSVFDLYVQSGGERSVSTMLYILALQELTAVPFFCVDEINQGMDSTNERLVFNMIIDMLSSDTGLAKTQYFLLTPKLLPDLTYSRKVKIHCIYSGKSIAERDVSICCFEKPLIFA
ncbi:unnamed protein product [Gongylonema pulchrum]|uniref:Structural maintenance of chromosomes protein 5 n=1 Tax=Gongylonema pulchrum TaxID=637853 RepID=A0A3P7QRZ0_9BILA|nr:unnamed protein product [Gongylonema pulchrum]